MVASRWQYVDCGDDYLWGWTGGYPVVEGIYRGSWLGGCFNRREIRHGVADTTDVIQVSSRDFL